MCLGGLSLFLCLTNKVGYANKTLAIATKSYYFLYHQYLKRKNTRNNCSSQAKRFIR